jgi:hypothetical protein
MNHRDYQQAFDLVKEFYDHAWSTLLVITGIMLGFVGVISPLMNYFMSKTNNSKLKNLEKEYEKQKKSMESMAIETKIALGGMYLHHGNLLVIEYKIKKDGFFRNEPLDIYLSYLKSLNYFLDASIMRNINVAYDKLKQTSNFFRSDTDFNEYFFPELRFIYNQVIEKLEKEKNNELYPEIISYLNILFKDWENKYNKVVNKESPPQENK